MVCSNIFSPFSLYSYFTSLLPSLHLPSHLGFSQYWKNRSLFYQSSFLHTLTSFIHLTSNGPKCARKVHAKKKSGSGSVGEFMWALFKLTVGVPMELLINIACQFSLVLRHTASLRGARINCAWPLNLKGFFSENQYYFLEHGDLGRGVFRCRARWT